MHEIALAPLLVLLQGVAPPTEPSALEVLQKVDAFYSTSWNHLLVYSAVLFSVVGILVPVVIQWAQARAFRHEEGSIAGRVEAKLKVDLDALTRKLLDDAARRDEAARIELEGLAANLKAWVDAARIQSDANVSGLREELRQELMRAEGRSFLLQAGVQRSAGQIAAAVQSAAAAALLLSAAKDLGNLNRVIDLALEAVPRLDASEFEQHADLAPTLAKALEGIRLLNGDGAYGDVLAKLEASFRLAKQRKKA